MKPKVKAQKLDMLNGPIWNKLPQYALPVAATGILEQLFNASDIAIVGNFTGESRTAAVAAIGANSPIIGLILNLFIGIALGANVIIANAVGQKDEDAIHKAVHTSILVAVIGGVFVAILGELGIGSLLQTLHVPADVLPYALLYIRIYLLGMPAILLYNFEAAIFRSIGETKVPLMAPCCFRCTECSVKSVFCNCIQNDGKRSSNSDGDCKCCKFSNFMLQIDEIG